MRIAQEFYMHKLISKPYIFITFFAAFCMPSSPAWSGVFPSSTVGYLGGGDTRPCAFLTLNGVSQADPAIPGPWFALPKAHSQYKETFALLLSAKLTSRTVYVTTTGGINSSCGHAEVLAVSLEP
jgi:hypothetical protein